MSDPQPVSGEAPDSGHEAVMGQQPSSPVSGPAPGSGGGGGRRRRRGGGGRGETPMVPEATFQSYYGRQVVRPSPWEADIPAYLFLGGLSAGSALLAAGSDLTGRTSLCRASRITSLAAIGVSFAALIHDLGRPERFHHMLRVAKVTSPMSVGTWLLTAYSPLIGLATASEFRGLLPRSLRTGLVGRALPAVGRGSGVLAAVVAPTVAAYTAVLLTDTATPTWHDAGDHLPFVFVGSASAASGGMGMINGSVAEAGPARRLAVVGAVLDLVVVDRMEKAMGLTAEPLHQGRPGQLMQAAKACTAAGAVLTTALGRRSKLASVVAGALLLAGSACTRFGVFYAGQASALDPKYTVEPQRARVDAGKPVRFED